MTNDFLEGYLRRGQLAPGMTAVEMPNDWVGFALSRKANEAIAHHLDARSPIRKISKVVSTGFAGYREVVLSHEANFEVRPSYGNVIANAAASNAMLQDPAFDVENWIASEVANDFGRSESPAFVSGDGVNKPRGFLAVPSSAQIDGVRAFGTLQYLATGVSGDFPATDPQDTLIDLVQSLRSPYRQGAVFVMNSFTLAILRKMKTSGGEFIWAPGLTAAQPDMLLGYPTILVEDMPNIGAGTTPIAFGNFKAAYLIADSETLIVRDPIGRRPFVQFFATKRVGGTVSDFDAIKLLRFAEG